jgi:MFS family permease
MPRGLQAFRHRDYRIFWFAQLASLTGTWMQSLAQSWLVLSITNSPFQLGLVGVCQFGPTLLLGLPGGVLADRIAKRRLLMVTQLIAGLLTGLLALLVITARVELWHIYATALGLGVVNAIDMPTRQAFVAEIVGGDDLMNAVALNSALFNATRVIGPALGGLLIANVGLAICFGLNALSYVPVVLGLSLMRTSGVAVATGSTESIRDRLAAGLIYVRSTPAALLPIALVGFVATFGMNFNVWLPLLARHDLALGPDGLGALMSALGIGSFSGALLLAFRGRPASRRLLLATAAVFGLLEVGVALATAIGLPLPALVGLIAGVGAAMSTTMAIANTTVQTVVPDALRGRVMSIYMTVFAGTAPLGASLAGLLAGALGTPAAIAIGGGVVLTAASALGLAGSRVALRPSSGRAPVDATGQVAASGAGYPPPRPLVSRRHGDT